MASNTDFKDNKVKLTGLWKNKMKNGDTFLTGKLNSQAGFIILPNSFKKQEKDPDYYLYLRQNEKEDKPLEAYKIPDEL